MKFQQGLLLILLCLSTSAYNQILRKHIRNYGPEITRSGEYAVSLAIDKKGLPYFGTEKGVLLFQGDRWRNISLKDESGVRALEYDTLRNRIWVGGAGTFGYLTCDVNLQYRYVSLSDSVIKEHPFKQVWQILPEQGKVTFMSNEAHFVWYDSGRIEWKDFTNTFIYLIDGVKYYSQKKGSLKIEQKGSLIEVWDQPNIREAVYQIVRIDADNHLLLTPYNGVYRFNLKEQKVTPYESPLHVFLKDHTFYDANQISDSLIAIGTWYDGVLLTDIKGNIIDKAGTINGMTSNGISDMDLDPFGKLWVATEYGITQIDLGAAWPNRFKNLKKPYAYTRQININNDSAVYVDCLTQSISLSRKPSHLTFLMNAPGLDIVTGKIVARLDGVDSDWVPVEQYEIEYSQLGNGEFIFNVKLEGSDDQTAITPVTISIQEPWYQVLVDFWQYIAYTAAFILMLVFVLTYRFRISKRVLTRMVTEKTKAIEEHKVELLKMNESLKQVNEELDILLYRSSHDLISPVKSVKGLLNLVRISPQEQETYFELMEDRIGRLENILTELNSYIKNIKSEPVLNHVYIKQLCTDVWQEMEFLETATKLDLQLEVADDLIFKCDRSRLKVVISNLVGNSIKYCDLRKENPFLKIEAIYQGGEFIIRISDNGRGIRPEHKTRLFEMFYRATEGSNGLGLGLYLVKKIIDSLQGSITIDSEFGQWTKVEVKLPVPK